MIVIAQGGKAALVFGSTLSADSLSTFDHHRPAMRCTTINLLERFTDQLTDQDLSLPSDGNGRDVRFRRIATESSLAD